MEESEVQDEAAPATGRKLPTVPRLPRELVELFAVAHEGGMTTAQIGALFGGLNPRTVRAAIARLPDEELRAIRRVMGMFNWTKHQAVLDGLHDELLRRIEAGDLGMRDAKGRYLEGFGALVQAAATMTDRKPLVANEAGMAAGGGEGGGARTTIGKFLESLTEARDVLRALPEGERARVQVVAASIEVGGERQVAGVPLSVDAEVSDG